MFRDRGHPEPDRPNETMGSNRAAFARALTSADMPLDVNAEVIHNPILVRPALLQPAAEAPSPRIQLNPDNGRTSQRPLHLVLALQGYSRSHNLPLLLFPVGASPSVAHRSRVTLLLKFTFNTPARQSALSAARGKVRLHHLT